MGNSHNTNLIDKDSTYMQGIDNGFIVCFGNSLQIRTLHTKENVNADMWAAKYEIGEKLEKVVNIILTVKHDKNGVESVDFVLQDESDNGTDILVDIARVGDVLHGGMNINRSYGSYSNFKSKEQDYLTETNIISYACSYRDCLFVFQKKKRHYSVEVAYNMAHYYVTKTFGLYVEAKVFRNKEKRFVLEVNGPFIYQSVYLGRVIDETHRSGNWSSGGKPNNEIEDSDSSLNSETRRNGNWSPGVKSSDTGVKSIDGIEDSNSSLNSKNIIGQIVERGSNRGLINSNGYTKGNLNNAIFCTIM